MFSRESKSDKPSQRAAFVNNLSSTSAKPEAPLMDSSPLLRLRMRMIGRRVQGL